MKHDRPVDVSVLIVSWETRDLTRKCLDSLQASVAPGTEFEVIVVDNGSSDGSRDMLKAKSDITLISNQRNLGYAAAVNQAYCHARGRYVLLLNSDVEVSQTALSRLVEFLDKHPAAAGVSPAHFDPDGSLQLSCRRLPVPASVFGSIAMLRRFPWFRRQYATFEMRDVDLSSARAVPQPVASCLLLRRDDSDVVLMDEGYPLYFNDVDLARRIGLSGRQLWIEPAATVTHALGASCFRLPDHIRARHHLASLVRYLRRSQTLSRPLLWLFLGGTFIDRVFRLAARLPGRMPLGDLMAALKGEPGSLPQPPGDTWVIVCSPVPWNDPRQRVHALSRLLARSRRVLFLQPPSLRPSLEFQVVPVEAGIWVATLPTILPLYRHLPVANYVNRVVASRILRRWLDLHPGPRLLWLDEDLAEPMSGRIQERHRVYDIGDLDWTFARWWNRRYLRRSCKRCLAKAEIVFTSSSQLALELPAEPAALIELVNGCDPEHFAPNGGLNPDVADLAAPRIGYLGALDERAFDTELVLGAARLRPNWTFVLVGPGRRSVCRRLSAMENIHLLGSVSYDAVPEVLRSFDVSLIPYKVSSRTRYVHPKKLYEYLAAGKPVVSTPLPAVVASQVPVWFASTSGSLVDAIESILAQDAGNGWSSATGRQLAIANSWCRRSEILEQALSELDIR